MKTFPKALLTLVAMSSSAFAGEDISKEVIPPPVDNPYFIGGTIGHLDEMDTEFYSFHIGKDLDNQFLGCDQSVYLEIGYADTDGDTLVIDPNITSAVVLRPLDYSFELIPLTLNYKLEKELSPNFNAYLGAGAGVAFTDSKVSVGALSDSDSDTVFFAQAFAGILYNINESWEAYGGARFIYFDEPDNDIWDGIEALDAADNNDWLAEIGLRYNF